MAQLSADLAWRNERVHWYVGAIQKMKDPHNTAGPLRIQLLVRVPLTESSDKMRRNLFILANAFPTHYMSMRVDATS